MTIIIIIIITKNISIYVFIYYYYITTSIYIILFYISFICSRKQSKRILLMGPAVVGRRLKEEAAASFRVKLKRETIKEIKEIKEEEDDEGGVYYYCLQGETGNEKIKKEIQTKTQKQSNKCKNAATINLEELRGLRKHLCLFIYIYIYLYI